MTEAKTIWIGDLEPWIDEHRLAKMVQKQNYSHLFLNGKVVRDKTTGASMRYGFLEFLTRQAAQGFLAKTNGNLIPQPNKCYRLNWANSPSVATARINSNDVVSVYLGDIDQSIDQAKLLSFFRDKYQSVKSVRIQNDHATIKPKRFGFVNFSNPFEAQKAIKELHGQMLVQRQTKETQQKGKGRYAMQTKQPYLNSKQLSKANIDSQPSLQSKSENSNPNQTLQSTMQSFVRLTVQQTRGSEMFMNNIPRSYIWSCKKAVLERDYC